MPLPEPAFLPEPEMVERPSIAISRGEGVRIDGGDEESKDDIVKELEMLISTGFSTEDEEEARGPQSCPTPRPSFLSSIRARSRV